MLKDFGGRRQEGYRTVGGALVRGFTRFKEGDDDRGFPDGRDVGRLKGKVVEFGEVGEGRWTMV